MAIYLGIGFAVTMDLRRRIQKIRGCKRKVFKSKQKFVISLLIWPIMVGARQFILATEADNAVHDQQKERR